MTLISNTDLDVHPICLGGNVFGWTADRDQSFQVLDAYVAAGGNFIDTADVYSAFAPGNKGGESETILGEWFAANPSNRASVTIATKVGQLSGRTGLSAATVKAACDDSLQRLQTDVIDLYYAHIDDADTPLEETLGAFDELVKAGKVRYVAASNYSAARLVGALQVSASEGFTSYVALQPQYSLLARDKYEGPLEELCASRGLACFPYWGLAAGYLTGKYRESGVESARSQMVGQFAGDKAERVPCRDGPDRRGAYGAAGDRGTGVAAVKADRPVRDRQRPEPGAAGAATAGGFANTLC